MQEERIAIDKEFFVIDSNNMDNVCNRLYGYTIMETGVVDDKMIVDYNQFKPSGLGIYVYVVNKDDLIIISQDSIGGYGLYLFQDGDYFAISNSFLKLIEHIKFDQMITINEDYVYTCLGMDLSSEIYRQTMINEIIECDRNSEIRIKKNTGIIEEVYNDPEENSVAIDTFEGIRKLDGWFDKWTRIIRNIDKSSDNMIFHLSGGMDSRLTFMLALKSGINIERVNILSINNDKHTFSEDFKIASRIANYYNIKLDEGENDNIYGTSYLMNEILDASFYLKLPFCLEMFYSFKRSYERQYVFCGFFGAYIREWKKSTNLASQQLVDKYKQIISSVYKIKGEEYAEPIRRVFEKSLEYASKIRNKDYKRDITSYLLETRGRHHHGKESVEHFFGNRIDISPLADNELRGLTTSSKKCNDPNLLYAMILDRYEPTLLDFPFQGGRRINKETLEYARMTNIKYPKKTDCLIHDNPKISIGNIRWDAKSNFQKTDNSVITEEKITNYIIRLYKSSKVKSLLCEYFSEHIYNQALCSVPKEGYKRIRSLYGMLGIAAVLNELKENSEKTGSEINVKKIWYMEDNII